MLIAINETLSRAGIIGFEPAYELLLCRVSSLCQPNIEIKPRTIPEMSGSVICYVSIAKTRQSFVTDLPYFSYTFYCV